MLNVVCLKHGTKYSADHVNKLYNMVQRHLAVPHNFYCFTENVKDLSDDIRTIHLFPHPKISGWWWKPYIFKAGHFPEGDTILFFDLDMVIIGNIDMLITYLPGEFVGLRDVSRKFKADLNKLGSAVMRWTAGEHSDLWDELEKSPNLTKSFHGDQDWIWHRKRDQIEFFPDKWIQSYKWEIRSREELTQQGSKFLFKEVRNPEIDPETAVLAFHGTPNPEDVQDPIIVDNWR